MVLRGVIGIAAAVAVALMPEVATLSYALVTLGVLIAWAFLTGALEIAPLSGFARRSRANGCSGSLARCRSCWACGCGPCCGSTRSPASSRWRG
jgi:hypothetical protein